MKVLGVAFSARKEGNCSRLIKYCLKKFKERGFKIDFLNVYELEIKPCSHCGYECFANKGCPLKDDVPKLYKKCIEADIIIFAIPTYSGHLSSLYFAFTERLQGQRFFKDFQELEEKMLKKINLIIIGNLSAGGDMALHQALYHFWNLEFWPETLLFSAQEYGKSSINGDLIEVLEIKKRLDRFIKTILKNVKKQQQHCLTKEDKYET